MEKIEQRTMLGSGGWGGNGGGGLSGVEGSSFSRMVSVSLPKKIQMHMFYKVFAGQHMVQPMHCMRYFIGNGFHLTD